MDIFYYTNSRFEEELTYPEDHIFGNYLNLFGLYVTGETNKKLNAMPTDCEF